MNFDPKNRDTDPEEDAKITSWVLGLVIVGFISSQSVKVGLALIIVGGTALLYARARKIVSQESQYWASVVLFISTFGFVVASRHFILGSISELIR